ncbi:MAG: amino acid ABC transporter substrate-binding protein [Verrucomicrobiota bacterium]|nr:amino acid ABC transporter substrate-binding protein [Verrucomicrobiota bacterium]
MLKNIVILFSFIATCAFSSNTKQDSLIIGTNAEFPPFTYMEKGEIVGFDIDVAREVCKRLGKNPSFKNMPFEALIPDLLLSHVDFVAAGMSYTPERAKRVLFTKNYLSGDPLVILTLKQKKLHIDQLAGKKVAVNEGYTSDFLLTPRKDISLTRLATTADGFLALQSKRVDAFVTAQSTIDAFFAKQDRSLFEITPIEGTGETCALVLPLKKEALLKEIQSALDAMEQDGTLSTLRSKWKL